MISLKNSKITKILENIEYSISKSPADRLKKRVGAFKNRIDYFKNHPPINILELAELKYCQEELKNCYAQISSGKI